MTSLAHTEIAAFFVPASPASSGTSPSAQFVNTALGKALLEWERTATRSIRVGNLQAQLRSIADECSGANWDGYGGKPVSPVAVEEARRFLTLIPHRLLPDEILAEPHGGIAFQWNGPRLRSLVLSLNGTKTIEYAAIRGPVEQDSGKRTFAGLLPSFVLRLISEFR